VLHTCAVKIRCDKKCKKNLQNILGTKQGPLVVIPWSGGNRPAWVGHAWRGASTKCMLKRRRDTGRYTVPLTTSCVQGTWFLLGRAKSQTLLRAAWMMLAPLACHDEYTTKPVHAMAACICLEQGCRGVKLHALSRPVSRVWHVLPCSAKRSI
jgi:hypothetical protein